MLVLIAGGGHIGAQLAVLLLGQKHEVHLIEHRKEILLRLYRELPTQIIYEGHPTDPQLLEQAGIHHAQVLTACTSNDADNLTLCFLARTCYNVPRTIARICNSGNAWLFDQKFHVDAAFNQAEILTGLIEEEISPNAMMTLLKLRRGLYSLVKEKIPPGAKAIGVAIKDLDLPEQCVIAAILRDGKIVIPRGLTAFEKDDEVLAITNRPGAMELAKLLGPPNSKN